jgi:phytoene dehydrogenase-like protein
VSNVDEFEGVRAILCDVTPRQLLSLAAHRFTPGFRQELERYRYGPGVFKVDWALNAPIPWQAAGCRRAATVHIGGSLAEIAVSEEGAWDGKYVDRPFLILAQPSLFDATRAPQGYHTAWAYCHVPNGSRQSLINEVETQIERFAPGFRDTIVGRHMFTAASMEQHNPNLVGGDINGGAQDLPQLFTRPTWRLYRTSAKGIYICSASTPPGGGVHGMCGYGAAQVALNDIWGRDEVKA